MPQLKIFANWLPVFLEKAQTTGTNQNCIIRCRYFSCCYLFVFLWHFSRMCLCPTYRFMVIFIFFVVWGPRVVKSKKHKVSDSHPSLMGNYHKSYLHISAIIFGWMAKVWSRRFTKNDVINGRLITTNSVLKQSIE